MWSIISVLVENKPGVLFKITNLFRAKNYNIDSISVGVTENPEFSKMTITTAAEEKQLNQIIKQLDKLIDTVEVKLLDEKKSIYRELVLMKIKVNKPSDIMEITDLANAFKCNVHDVRKSSIIVEITATPDRIDAFEDLIRGYGILEIARTGICALERGYRDES
ncbi:MAG: acetolactate synthase small subunit [Thaumarchaeota archaeon 13_1_40CM_38_12]|nr:MAG: acetolactate synthase small subunit [Thaumarchaeota archaeon 13_1_40CM_38_12]OLC35101.1 MAG: acetolactate synthase small subunit [Thaumarchaeota archaeon 13_1_40CM_4_38_7]OLC92636.1 MAG: acetolactate synthase small subunit [Thaumarchaeota archaeon 13_1_40CM_3_38_6]OLD30643.1 MAG: acetolactate synthase small subunit [Thaumarchaeota archaeon 13_1_40CM_2_39_7]TLY05147.1 MAG: acetolactate synthase small subunit [Nitrososphaerota archaeon]